MAKGLPAAAIALAAAVIAGLIAYRQYRVAKAKLNLDLFERRMKIFDATRAFLSKTGGTRAVADPAALAGLFHEAQFLFGEEIREYMVGASERMRETQRLSGVATAAVLYPDAADSPEVSARYIELKKWFVQEEAAGCRNKFAPYLDFSKWR